MFVWMWLAGCLFNPRIEGTEVGDCFDAADNDADGLFDCDDPSCMGSPTCATSGEDSGGNGDSGNSAMTEAEFQDASLSEVCRILVLCEYYQDVATCVAELGPSEVDETCTYQADYAGLCIGELQATNSCPSGEDWAPSCAFVYTDCEGSDSGL